MFGSENGVAIAGHFSRNMLVNHLIQGCRIFRQTQMGSPGSPFRWLFQSALSPLDRLVHPPLIEVSIPTFLYFESAFS